MTDRSAQSFADLPSEGWRRIVRPVFIGFLISLFFLPIIFFGWLHAAAAEDGKIHLRYMSWGNPEQQKTDADLLAKFERLHPDIKVDSLLVPAAVYGQKLQVMLFSATEPDVFRMDESMLPKFFDYGYFEPLDSYIANDHGPEQLNLSDFFPQALAGVTHNGRLYGVNVTFGGKLIYYNKDLFTKAGLPDPYDQLQKGEWTFDAMLHAAQKLTHRDASGNTSDYGLRLEPTDLFWICWGYGGQFFHEDGTPVMDEPQSLEALRFYSNLLRGSMGPDHGVMPLPGEGIQGAWTFESGTLGMVQGFAGEAPHYRNNCTFNWDVIPVPAGPAGRFSIVKGNGLIMSVRSPHKQAAWDLLKFMVSPEVEKEICGDSLRRAIPTRKSVAASEAFLQSTRTPFNVGTFLELYKTAHALPFTGRWSYDSSSLGEWVDRLSRGTVTVEQCAQGIQADLAAKFATLDAQEKDSR